MSKKQINNTIITIRDSLKNFHTQGNKILFSEINDFQINMKADE